MVGAALFELARRQFKADWDEARPAIDKEIKRREAAREAAPLALELRDVRKAFGKTAIIRGASLAVQPGERVAIIGPNGAGKSTLFNLISGRFAPSSGEILLNGRRIDGAKPHAINRLGLARSFQVSTSSPTSRCSRTCAARCSGASATATRSGSSWPTSMTPTTAPKKSWS